MEKRIVITGLEYVELPLAMEVSAAYAAVGFHISSKLVSKFTNSSVPKLKIKVFKKFITSDLIIPEQNNVLKIRESLEYE